MKNGTFAIQLTVLAVLFLLPSLVHAQPPDFGGDDVSDVPIDGGLSLLIATGLGYGIKKVKARKR